MSSMISWLISVIALQGSPDAIRMDLGPAELAPRGARAILQIWDEPTYRKIAGQVKDHFKDTMKVLGKPPREVTDSMRFGINLTIDGTSRVWALLDDGKEAARLWIDFDFDGDLDDETPLAFTTKNGESMASFSRRFDGKVGAETVAFDCAMEFTIGEIEIPGSTDKEKVLFLREKMVKRGTVKIGDHDLAVAVVATGGIYNDPYQLAFFDLDGNGDFKWEDRQSPERFRIDENFVRLFDHGYAFRVDRYGRFLELIPTSEPVPERANLAIGEKVPAFEGTDIDGNAVKLSDYAGKYVLLDFWSVGCAPCVAEVGKLVDAYTKYHDRGFEILGINGDASRLDLLRKLLDTKGMKWRQIAQDETKGPLMRQFRIAAYPTCYLVDPDGEFLLLDARADKLVPYLDHLFEP